MPAPDSFTTERLVARRIERDDEPFLRGDVPGPGGATRRSAVRVMRRGRASCSDRMIDHWDRRGLRRRGSSGTARTGEPVGWVGLHDTDIGGPGGVELLVRDRVARDGARGWRPKPAAPRSTSRATRSALDELVCFTLAGQRRRHSGRWQGLGFVDAGPVGARRVCRTC